MRGFFSVTRALMGPLKSGFRFQNQRQRVQTRITANQITQILRMSTTLSGLRLANVFDLSMFSVLEESQGNKLNEIPLDDSKDLDTRQIGLHLGCTQ